MQRKSRPKARSADASDVPPRRLISEFVRRANAEPTLNTVVVEGNYDQELIKWLMKSQKLGISTSVLRIDQIEMPSSMLGEYSNNNRGRIVALASKICEDVGNNVFCFVDSDFDHLLSDLPKLRILHATDFSSAELYLYADPVLDKYLGLICRSDIELSIFRADAERALISAFRVRLANEQLKWNMKIVPLERDLIFVNGRVEYDQVAHLNRLLDVNRRRKDRDIFESAYNGQYITECDPRLVIHGHDLFEYLAWYANEATGDFQNPDSITRLLVGFGTPDCYLSYPRIAHLISLLL